MADEERMFGYCHHEGLPLSSELNSMEVRQVPGIGEVLVVPPGMKGHITALFAEYPFLLESRKGCQELVGELSEVCELIPEEVGGKRRIPIDYAALGRYMRELVERDHRAKAAME